MAGGVGGIHSKFYAPELKVPEAVNTWQGQRGNGEQLKKNQSYGIHYIAASLPVRMPDRVQI